MKGEHQKIDLNAALFISIKMSSHTHKKKNKIVVESSPSQKDDGGEWLRKNWPNARKIDHDWTMERYDYPPFVRQYIRENWVKVSDKNGGTYARRDWWQIQLQKE